MTTAIIYARFSPRPQESDSIQAQVEDLQDYCDRNHWDVKMVCYDPDTSGTIPLFQRPGLRRALENLQPGDVLVIRNLNRAARSVVVGLAIEEEVERAGAMLAVTENGGLQPTKLADRNAWCMRVIMYLMADMQRMELNDRTSRRMRQHQSNGRAMGGHAPYGHTKVGAELVVNQDEQETITLIKEAAASGLTPWEITVRLRDAGVPARGTEWHVNTVKRILKR